MSQKKIFSKVGFAFFLLNILAVVVALILGVVVSLIEPALMDKPIMTWVLGLLPIYLIGMPVCALRLRKVPAQTLYKSQMSGKQVFRFFTMAVPIMVIGNIMGNCVMNIISNLTSAQLSFDLEEALADQGPGMILLFAVIIGPILEELFFRKILVDRIIVFGDKAAILVSGLMFGLFHGNFYQFFYAFGLGCLLAYVYIRSGKLKYCIIIHTLINFFGGLIPNLITQHLDLDAMVNASSDPDMMLSFLMQNAGAMVGCFFFGFVMLVLLIVGFVNLVTGLKKIEVRRGEYSAPAKVMAGYMFANPGMILFLIGCAVMFVTGMMN